jgi:hypothetical protein
MAAMFDLQPSDQGRVHRFLQIPASSQFQHLWHSPLLNLPPYVPRNLLVLFSFAQLDSRHVPPRPARLYNQQFVWPRRRWYFRLKLTDSCHYCYLAMGHSVVAVTRQCFPSSVLLATVNLPAFNCNSCLTLLPLYKPCFHLARVLLDSYGIIECRQPIHVKDFWQAHNVL